MDIPYVRKLTSAEDQKQFSKVMATAFIYPFDEASFEPKTQDQLAQSPETMYGYGDPVSSGMVIHSFDVWFDGSLVKATGVGGVATLPESRGSGGIRKIFEALMPEWYRDGVTFSVLYPFSHEFYRQFGYELCQKGYRYRLPIESLKSFPHDVCARVVTDFQELKTIAEIFGQKNNLYIKRKDSQWHRVSKDPSKDLNFTYAIGDEAFFSCVTKKADKEDERHTLRIRDIAYRDEKALSKILGFLYTFRSQYAFVEMNLPPVVPLMHMIPECYDADLQIESRGMARIVNVSRALRQMRYPGGTGRFTLYVTDPQLKENTGVYRISYAEGRATSVMKLGDDPSQIRPEDASSIQVFKAEPEQEEKPRTFFDDEQPTGFMTAKDWEKDAEPLAGYMTHTSSASAGFLADADSARSREEAAEKEKQAAAALQEAQNHVSDDFITPIDLTCSIQVLTQLVTGAISIDQALYLPGVVCAHPASLRAVFCRKDIFFTDGF